MIMKFIKRSVYGVIFLIWWTLTVKCAEDDFNTETGKQIIRLAKTAEIKSFMNETADPCDDFYNYACGLWPRINSAQYSGSITTDRLQALAKGIERKFNNLLQKDKTGKGDIEDKIKDFYASCLNVRSDHGKYHAALTKVYKSIGEFSVFKTEEQKSNSNFNWWSTIAKIQNKYGKFIILSLYIYDDPNDESKTMPYIGAPVFEMTVGAVHFVQEKRIRKLLRLYLNMNPDQAATIAQNIMAFEKSLALAATDKREGKSLEELLTLYNTTDLHEKYQYLFDVKEYLGIALGSKELPEQVYVFDESYLKGLYEVFNSTDEEHVEDYILWLFIEDYLVDTTSMDLRQECTDRSKKYFGKFIDHVIYNQYRSKEAEAQIFELWDDIKTTFKQDLESNKYDWISNETRTEAIKKLNNMKLTINSYDNDDFVKLFKNLDIDPSSYVVNVEKILENAESLIENKLEKKTEEDTQELSFTPLYNILENEIKIPVALLQPRYIWDPNYPKAIQYGTLGYLLAHEMIHGFDDEGRNYDSNGNANNWWDENSAYEFESRRKCFEKQYHDYTYDGERLPKSALQSENTADNGGINIAYKAYERWLNKRKVNETHVEMSETLPRLDFNNRQLFFISFAQDWCGDIHSLFRSTFASVDDHAPGNLRVIGTLSNSRAFSWIFKCNKKTAKMDPPEKCEIY